MVKRSSEVQLQLDLEPAKCKTSTGERGHPAPEGMLRGLLSSPRKVKDFVLSGNAHFTVRSRKTQERYTYRVNAPKNGTEFERAARKLRPLWFVSVLNGPDNTRQYQYAGLIRDTLEFHRGDKSSIQLMDRRLQAFYWFWNAVIRPEDQLRFGHMEVWHEGRCGVCGRRLTVPESIESGYGPECVTKRKA